MSRTETVSIRLTPDERAAVEAAAARDGRTVGEWLRELARAAVRAAHNEEQRQP